MQRRPTIKDIARLAGVSYSSVSRALSGSREIGEETRARILAICAQEGYQPNSVARSLISRRSNVIGLIVPDISNLYYAGIALQLEIHARKFGYNVMLCNSLYDRRKTIEQFDYLTSMRVDGIVFVSTRSEARQWAARYCRELPVVLLGDAIDPIDPMNEQFNSVSLDNHAGGYLGARYLQSLGHRDILYLGLRATSVTHRRRYAGYTAAMQEAELIPHQRENPYGSSTIESGYQLARELFRGRMTHTAIFCASDAVALGVLQAAAECGISVPEELSLLGFDDVSFASLPRIELTTISQQSRHMAEAAIDLLCSMLDGDSDPVTTHRIIHPLLIERRSCARPR